VVVVIGLTVIEGPEAPVDQEKVPGPDGDTEAFNVVDSP